MTFNRKRLTFAVAMKIFLHVPDNGRSMYERWEKGIFPGHFLYGATHFGEYGIEMVMRVHKEYPNRLMRMLDGARQILFCKEHYEAVFATYHNGIAIVVMMRALGLFRKKIVVWHHQPVIKSPKWWREWLGKIYYRGMDSIIFFSEKLRDESVRTGKIKASQAHVCHWGADMAFYDRVMATVCPKSGERVVRSDGEGMSSMRFISTGKELRDMPTLVSAFNRTGQELDIYISKHTGGEDYEALFSTLHMESNVHVHFTEEGKQSELSYRVAEASCVVICCKETNYTVGLTTVVEALALGKPIICSRNPNIPVDFDKEGCGISVDYYDVEGWVKAVDYIAAHPTEALEMGKKAYNLARTLYNDEVCGSEVAGILVR